MKKATPGGEKMKYPISMRIKISKRNNKTQIEIKRKEY